MCLVLLGWQARADLPLAVAANRDEFHARPASPAAFWNDAPSLLAGRDLQAGGTWMGVSRSGRFAAVTNYRGGTEPSAQHSRGSLVFEFLNESLSPGEFVRKVEKQKTSYSGFNLLVADESELWWFSNRDTAPRRLEPGIYGLGNLLLDSQEVEAAKKRFESALRATPAPEPFFAELAKAKIVNSAYGTRCSTVLLKSGANVRYAERRFSESGAELGTLQFQFALPTRLAA